MGQVGDAESLSGSLLPKEGWGGLKQRMKRQQVQIPVGDQDQVLAVCKVGQDFVDLEDLGEVGEELRQLRLPIQFTILL